MRQKLLLIVTLLILLFSVVPAQARFPDEHVYLTIRGMREVNSPITQLCGDRLHLMIGGDNGADAPVIHYADNKVSSYIGTHGRGEYLKCLEDGGNDIDLRCMCYGLGIHRAQDNVHVEDWGIPRYIKEYLAPNIIIHAIVERAYQNKLNEYLKTGADKYTSYDEVQQYSVNSLDPFMYDEKYMKLFNSFSGVDMYSDIAIVSAALKGHKWDSTVYGKKVGLPSWAWIIGFAILVFSGVWLLLIYYSDTNKFFKIFSGLQATAVFVFGVIFLLSIMFGKSWIWFNMMISPFSSMITITDSDLKLWEDNGLRNTKLFLETGDVAYDDASGLAYCDINEVCHKGPLSDAEKRYNYVVVPIFSILMILYMGWMFKMLLVKKK